MSGAVIEARGIVNRFGDQVVHDGLDLTLEKGEILGLVGGSGSGKSVLLRTILGLNKPAGGTIRVSGKNVVTMKEADKREMARKWGVLFQDGALFSGLSVLDNIALPLREHTSLSKEDAESLAAFKLEMAGLESEAAAKFPSALSGGMVRRAALARALALDPEILFLDEPTGGLDPMAAAAFDELILKLRRVLRLSVLIITHDLDTLVAVCDRIAMLVDKKAVVGTLKEMMRSDHPEIHEFFCGPRMRMVPRHEQPREGA
jgi:phospholipid/cholesterol/gamma-HCH transport system ATP-binding protein